MLYLKVVEVNPKHSHHKKDSSISLIFYVSIWDNRHLLNLLWQSFMMYIGQIMLYTLNLQGSMSIMGLPGGASGKEPTC